MIEFLKRLNHPRGRAPQEWTYINDTSSLFWRRDPQQEQTDHGPLEMFQLTECHPGDMTTTTSVVDIFRHEIEPLVRAWREAGLCE